MHFLCLHGTGTNNQVFKIQTAAIRFELGDEHTYEFVEGTVPWPMAPEISSLFDPSDKYYAYFDPDSAVSGLDALRLLDEYISAEGPFDSVLAFSQGACLAAMHIIRKAHHQHEAGLHRTAQALPFKCAIFLSGGAPRDPSAYEHRGELRILDPARDGRLIAIPTVHIWGDQDEWKSNSKLMKDMCREENATSFVHEGEHEVPGLGVKGAIIGTVNAMRRGIYRAEASM